MAIVCSLTKNFRVFIQRRNYKTTTLLSTCERYDWNQDFVLCANSFTEHLFLKTYLGQNRFYSFNTRQDQFNLLFRNESMRKNWPAQLVKWTCFKILLWLMFCGKIPLLFRTCKNPLNKLIKLISPYQILLQSVSWPTIFSRPWVCIHVTKWYQCFFFGSLKFGADYITGQRSEFMKNVT